VAGKRHLWLLGVGGGASLTEGWEIEIEAGFLFLRD
jgi:hypothetical protein